MGSASFDAAGPPVAVIGGGPCAAVAARELVAAGLPVTMLDAGVRAPRGIVVRVAGRTVMRWVEGGYLHTNRHRSTTVPRLVWTSSLSLGGLSNYWTGAVPRFAPRDFSAGAAIDERFDWPIRYEDLVPFYELVEADLTITAGDGFREVPDGLVAYRHRPPRDWRPVLRRLRQRGHDISEMPLAKGRRWMVALRPREFTSQHCVQPSFANAPNFTHVAGARVTRIVYSPSAGAAEAVSFVEHGSGEAKTMAVSAVVVAAGALDSTEILLRSRSKDFPTGLGNAHGVLGRYFHDHPREWWQARMRRTLTALDHPIYVPREAADDKNSPLSTSSLLLGIGAPRDRLLTMANLPTRRLGVQVVGTMVPREEFGVSLVDGSDPDDPASALQIDVAYDAAAVATVHRGRERFVELFADAGIPVDLGPFHELVIGESVHFGGTARMHHRPEYGVVDAWNRLHGVPNVIIADASTFTTGPEKNPTLTAMAIAARAARRLAADLA
jgi:choline dehydrogenase-like flavoprotein